MTEAKEETMKTMTDGHAGPRSHHHRAPACTTTKLPDPPHEAIALRAHQLYMDCGCPEGRDVEFWLEAERQLKAPLVWK
jgi:Protein of unknown function (DUF2934)